MKKDRYKLTNTTKRYATHQKLQQQYNLLHKKYLYHENKQQHLVLTS